MFTLLLAQRQRDITGTWLDAFNFMDLIPSPVFLFLFLLYSAFVILVLRLLLPRIQALLEPPNPFGEHLPLAYKPDYMELAYIRGTRKAVVETILCNLYRLQLVDDRLRLLPRIPNTKLHPLEIAVLNACSSSMAPHEIAGRVSVQAAFAEFEASAAPRLRALGLIPTRITMLTFLAVFLSAVVLIDGLGAIRVARSMMRGFTNVEILVILMFAVLPAAWLLLFPRRSAAGAHYLRTIRSRSIDLIRRVQARLDSTQSPDLLYALAACGAAALGGTAYDSIRRQLNPPLQYNSSSSSCSSCGGGGCGGGGCGGGGCGGGGCGGGGCGGG